jgi:hypothetical protein
MSMLAQKGGKIISSTDCNPALEVGGWLAPWSGRFTPQKTLIPIVLKVGWAWGAGLDGTKIDPQAFQPVASRYTDYAISSSTGPPPDNICHSRRLIRVWPRKTTIITVQCTNQNIKYFFLINLNTFNRTRTRKLIHGLQTVGDISNQFNQTNKQAPNLVLRFQANKRNCWSVYNVNAGVNLDPQQTLWCNGHAQTASARVNTGDQIQIQGYTTERNAGVSAATDRSF